MLERGGQPVDPLGETLARDEADVLTLALLRVISFIAPLISTRLPVIQIRGDSESAQLFDRCISLAFEALPRPRWN